MKKEVDMGRQRTAKEKAKIVMEYLRGRDSIVQICNKYQVSKASLFRWVQEVEDNMELLFDSRKILLKQKKLEKQVDDLKRVIGELTVELKKMEEETGYYIERPLV